MRVAHRRWHLRLWLIVAAIVAVTIAAAIVVRGSSPGAVVSTESRP